MKIEEVEKIDLTNLSNAKLDELLKYVEKRADEEAYCVGIQYNVRDVELVKRIDEKLQLLMLVLSLAYMCKIRLDDSFYQVRMWDTLIYNRLIENNVVLPPKKNTDKDEKYEGATVFEPKVGMHEWIVSADLNSLYPSLIRQYAISPENRVTRRDLIIMRQNHLGQDMTFSNACDELLEHWHPTKEGLRCSVEDFVNKSEQRLNKLVKKVDLSLAANGTLYKRNKGFLPQMMEELYNQRRQMKNHMLEAEKDIELIKAVMNDRK